MNRDSRTRVKRFSYPIGIRAINRLMSGYENTIFDASDLMKRAEKATGHTDFGDPFFVEPLTQLSEDINRNTTFHPLGAFLYKNKLLLNLINRLWAQYWFKSEVDQDAKLPPTLLITGLQRTGTTFLQRLLGSLPEFRGIISWEIINPVPKSRKKKYFGKYQSSIGHKMLNYLSPEFKSIHSVKPTSLEEEAALMDHTFMSSIAEASLNVPQYASWLRMQDHSHAYKDLKRWIQLLLWRKPAKDYLLLKSPHHMEYLDLFVDMFPNTKIVHMHRTPVKTMASYCSMVKYGKKIFMPSADTGDIGRHWLEKNERLMTSCLNFRKNHDHLFMDLAYHQLVKDPIDSARSIFEFLGLEWTNSHTQRALAFCEEHRKDKYGKHVYSLEEYGLSEELVSDTFEDYLNTYATYLS